MRRMIAFCFVMTMCLFTIISSALASTFGFGKEVTVQPGIVFDKNGVSIEIVDFSYKSSGAILTVKIHNNTNTEISVLGGAVGYDVYSVNRYMTGASYVNKNIEAKENLQIDIQFDDPALQLFGIDGIAELEFGFLLEDENDNELRTGPIKIHTSEHEGYNYSKNTYREYVSGSNFERDFGVECISFTEETLAKGNGVEVASWGVFRNINNELVLMIETKNNSDATVYLQGEGLCINGLKVSGTTLCYENMNPGCTSLCSINLTNLLEEKIATLFNIGEIDNVSFCAQVRDDNYKVIIPEFQMYFSINNANNSFNVNGVELYNDNGIRLVYLDMYGGKTKYDDGIYAMFFVENRSGKDIALDTENVYLNGERVAASFFGDVDNQECSAVELILYNYSFSKYNIEKTEDIKTMSIEFELRDTKYNTIDEFAVEVPIKN